MVIVYANLRAVFCVVAVVSTYLLCEQRVCAQRKTDGDKPYKILKGSM